MAAVRVPAPLVVQQKGTEEQLSQSGMLTTLATLARIPMLNGRLLSNVSFSAGVSKTVNHGLARKPQGLVPMLSPGSANAPVLNVTAWDTRGVTLTALGDCTADLWVF